MLVVLTWSGGSPQRPHAPLWREGRGQEGAFPAVRPFTLWADAPASSRPHASPPAGRGDPPGPGPIRGGGGRVASARSDRAPPLGRIQSLSTARVGADVAGRSPRLAAKKELRERTGFVGSHAVGHGQLVVEPGVGAEVVERAARSSREGRWRQRRACRLWRQRARPHTWGTGSRVTTMVTSVSRQFPTTAAVSRSTSISACAVGSPAALALVVTRRHQSPIDNRYGTHGYLALARRGGGPRRGRAPSWHRRSGLSGCRR